jgi:hypothetical protein
MEFGFNFPNGGPMATRDAIAAIAQLAEDKGYLLLAIPDHIVIPRAIGNNYPYSSDGSLPFSTLGAGERLDPLRSWPSLPRSRPVSGFSHRSWSCLIENPS